jgi:hypothetical protein
MKDTKRQFKIIRTIVNEWDPCSLIASGALVDEYDAITYKLLSGHANGLIATDQKAEVIQLLDSYYGVALLQLSKQDRITLLQGIDEVLDEMKNNLTNA